MRFPSMKTARAGLAALSAFSALACSDSKASNQTYGELGNGTFSYTCVRDDALCADGELATTFPGQVATGSVFRVSFDAKNYDAQSRFDVAPASTGVIEKEADVLRAKAPGIVALLATRTSDGRVLDFVHLRVTDISHIRFSADRGTLDTIWQTGVTENVRARPVDDLDVDLAGGLGYDWTVSDPKKLHLARTSPTAVMGILPIAPGAATVSVTAGTRTDSFDVTISGHVVNPEPDAGTSVDGGSRDAGPRRDASPPLDSGGARGTDSGLPDAGPRDGGHHD
jgi:hypothetical protein